MLSVYIGWDPRDELAYRVCEASLRKHASIPLNVQPLKDLELRKRKLYWRPYRVEENGQMIDQRLDTPFSTQFSFTRFLVPELEGYASDRAVFMDADFLWRGDIAEMLGLCTGDKALWCVQHDHRSDEAEKMGGLRQTQYHRKNWSSLMVFDPSKNKTLGRYDVNIGTGKWLHALGWLTDDEIGALPEAWNWLVGHSQPTDPKAVHFTLGTPDFDGLENQPYADEWRAYL